MKNMVKPALGTKNKTAGHSYVTVVNLCALVNDGQHLFFLTSAGCLVILFGTITEVGWVLLLLIQRSREGSKLENRIRS